MPPTYANIVKATGITRQSLDYILADLAAVDRELSRRSSEAQKRLSKIVGFQLSTEWPEDLFGVLTVISRSQNMYIKALRIEAPGLEVQTGLTNACQGARSFITMRPSESVLLRPKDSGTAYPGNFPNLIQCYLHLFKAAHFVAEAAAEIASDLNLILLNMNGASVLEGKPINSVYRKSKKSPIDKSIQLGFDRLAQFKSCITREKTPKVGNAIDNLEILQSAMNQSLKVLKDHVIGFYESQRAVEPPPPPPAPPPPSNSVEGTWKYQANGQSLRMVVKLVGKLFQAQIFTGSSTTSGTDYYLQQRGPGELFDYPNPQPYARFRLINPTTLRQTLPSGTTRDYRR